MLHACSCPHCHQSFAIDEKLINTAQGFVVCPLCEGILHAADHYIDANPSSLPQAKTVQPRLARASQANANSMSKHEIADLLDNWLPNASKTIQVAQPSAFNWNIATAIAAIILFLQLIYLWLLS